MTCLVIVLTHVLGKHIEYIYWVNIFSTFFCFVIINAISFSVEPAIQENLNLVVLGHDCIGFKINSLVSLEWELGFHLQYARVETDLCCWHSPRTSFYMSSLGEPSHPSPHSPIFIKGHFLKYSALKLGFRLMWVVVVVHISLRLWGVRKLLARMFLSLL